MSSHKFTLVGDYDKMAFSYDDGERTLGTMVGDNPFHAQRLDLSSVRLLHEYLGRFLAQVESIV